MEPIPVSQAIVKTDVIGASYNLRSLAVFAQVDKNTALLTENANGPQ